jgi:hypothetical protein
MLLTLNNAYKLAKVDGGQATFDARIATAIKTDPVSSFKVDLRKDSGSATFHHDVKAGRLVDASIRQALELNLAVANRDVNETIRLDAALKLLP